MSQPILVMIDHFHPYQSTVLSGVRHRLRQAGRDSVAVIGRNLGDPAPGIRRANEVYGLASPEHFAGLIVFAVSMGIYISDPEMQQFVDRFRPLPTVCIGQQVEGHPSVVADNQSGMEALLCHLIRTLGYTRLVFIRGIPGNRDSDVREQVFREVLVRHGLEVPEKWVVTGKFSSSGAQQALEPLLESGADFQVVVCANDEMAHGAITTLSQRGLRVPDDVAVVGFDDSEEFQHVVPALTTVRQPFFEQGVQAAEALLQRMAGDEVPGLLPVPTQLVVRASCGTREVDRSLPGSSNPFGLSQQHQVLERTVQQMKEAVQHENPERFLSHWRSMLVGRPLLDEEFHHWQDLLVQAALQVQEPLQDREWPVFSLLKDQAHIVLSRALQMLHANRRIHNVTRAMHLPLLFSAPDNQAFHQELALHLQHLSLPFSVLVLRDPLNPGQASVVLASGVSERVDFSPFPVDRLLPPSMDPVLHGQHLLLTPLFDQERLLGHLLYRPPSELFFDEESLCYTLSRAVHQHQQRQTLLEYAERLEREVLQRTRELQDAYQELQRSAFLDGLTGIYNRTAFRDFLERTWAQHSRKKTPLGLILCDVDFFKRYNDTLGHLQGDVCLKVVAQRIAQSVRKGDFVARFGGEEFVVVLPETDLQGTVQVAERIQQDLQLLDLSHPASEVSAQVTLSMGVTSRVPGHDLEPADLLGEADRLLYEAKRRGRARLVSVTVP